MPIDDCAHDFDALAGKVLPGYMRMLEDEIRAPIPMEQFAEPGPAIRRALTRAGYESDFSGCYVLIDVAPIYVGISRKVFARLRQHVTGTTHFDASLAYRMALARSPHSTTRQKAMMDPAFVSVFEDRRQYLRTLRCAAVAIENPVELYLFEVYAAMALQTTLWNTFRTH